MEEPTVLAVVLSAQMDYLGPHDVVIVSPDGGVPETCMAQTDQVVILAKEDLRRGRYQGTVQTDTLVRIRATVCQTIDGPR